MELTNQNLNKEAAINGVIMGILFSIIGISVFYVAPSLLGSFVFGIALKLVVVLIYIYFTIELRKKNGGYWTFKNALNGIFLMIFIEGLLYALINFAFYRFIEPNAFDVVAGHIESGTTKLLEKMGTEQDQIDEVIAQQVEVLRVAYLPTIGQFFKNLALGVIGQFILALIFAAIFKKEEPIFASAIEEEQE